MSNIIINKNVTGEIYPLFSGYEKCEPSHSVGPSARDYYIIHFCISGKGKLYDKYGIHEIGAGELFIMRRGEITNYSADDTEPWEYLWIAFIGEGADVFSNKKSVYSFTLELGEKIKEAVFQGVTSPYIYTSLIYELLHLLFHKTNEERDSVKLIKRYIDYNYMSKITVSYLAKFFSFDRSHLFKIFKARYKMGIKDYITSVRIKKAKELLSLGISVSKCASMVGYDDEFNFSKAFKKHTGITPSKWKENES